MKGKYSLQHRLAIDNPYKSVVKVFDCKEDDILVGIKNVKSIPNNMSICINIHHDCCFISIIIFFHFYSPCTSQTNSRQRKSTAGLVSILL